MDGWMHGLMDGETCVTHTEHVDVKSRGDITPPDIFCWTI